MKHILLAIITLLIGTSTGLSEEVIKKSDSKLKIRPEIITTNKVTRKPIKKIRKKPRIKPMIYHHYYTTTIEKNCDRYINIIEQKDKKIEALSNEIKNLKENKYEIMRQELKEEYEKEMKKFEERRYKGIPQP
ncbi:MAG TPA: hypothetical protein VIM88_00755 [Sulfurovum sp.]|uniref:hypothetical protein n=1 Tax=Sulfurovum sp. TaxID=1969726 RepID=UPI002F950942